MLKKVIRKILVILCNNLVVNQFLILIKRDDFIKTTFQKWASNKYTSIHSFKYDDKKSLAENVGYSNIPEILASIDNQKNRLSKFASINLKEGDNVLDVGCGLGLFMDVFEPNIKVNGIDLINDFLIETKKRFPNSNLYCGDFLNYKFEKKFKMIYFFGVLMYFEPSKIEVIFKRVDELLDDDAIIYFQYQHAVRFLDLYFADLSYMKYPPRFIEKRAKKYFDIEIHEHAFDGRTFKDYDRNPYYFPDGTNTRTDTNLNNYLMIARKKKIKA